MRQRLLILVSATLLIVMAPSAIAHATEAGLESVEASLSTTKAGAHPDFSTTFQVRTDPASAPNGFGLKEPLGVTRTVRIALPAGLLGNLTAVPSCSMAQLDTYEKNGGGCPNASQVGVTTIYAYGLTQIFHEPIYLMEPPAGGGSVARLGLIAGLYPTLIEARVRSEGDYGVTASVEEANSSAALVKAETILWGVPAAAAHDTERQTAVEAFNGASSSPARPPKIDPHPFLTNPTVCGQATEVVFSTDTWEKPGNFSTLGAPLPPMTGCDEIAFAPSLSVTPTNRAASSPTGLDALLSLYQNESPNGRATAAVRNSKVKLPLGMTIAPGAADGLSACSPTQARYQLPGPAECPDSAKIGSAEFDVPALARPLKGSIYQRTPEPGHLFRIWLIADEQGVDVKIPGEVEADPVTGQLTSTFFETPQVPLRHLRLQFNEGSKAPLATPAECGTYSTAFEFAPWSGTAAVAGETPMTIDENCGGGGFSPHMSAGSTVPLAGAFSSFVTRFTRADGEQNLESLAVTLPEGVLAKLAGVEVCPEQAAAAGNCPAGSALGSVRALVGVGATPLSVPQPGKAPTALYLAGPYKGAPYSLVVVVPAQAGPFDLGTVVTRAGIYVDPSTAQVTVKSDPLPQILEGVPVAYRNIEVDIDRPSFTINPTNCGAKSVNASLTSAEGSVAGAASRFAVAGCKRLGFGPHLSLALKGGMHRSGHPHLKSVLTFRHQGEEANTAKAQVLLPATEQIDQAHINDPCTRVQFNAEACPEGSVLGTATAWSPLLDRPLTGKVYFRSNGGERKLPDIVVDLRGQIDVVLVGFVDTIPGKNETGRLRTTFANVPDAPVSRFVLNLYGGKKGLLVNNANLCGRSRYATLHFTGQNGKMLNQKKKIATSCSGKKK